MGNRPELWSWALDVAQIVSAIFTAAAVIVSLWLAKRGESHRIKIQVQLRARENRSGSVVMASRPCMLHFVISNVGQLPVYFRDGNFRIAIKDQPAWLMGLGELDSLSNQDFHKLEHGQIRAYGVQVLPNEHPWKSLRGWWWILNRPKFTIYTTAGGIYVGRPSISLCRELEKEWLAPALRANT